MQPQFLAAIRQICDEKNLSEEVVIETVEAALAAAYKKDFGDHEQEVTVDLNTETGEATVHITKEVVEEVENPHLQISVADAQKIKKGAKAGETVELTDTPSDFGRIAAQTAKQVIIQRIREAERDVVFNEYKDKEGDLLNGVVQRLEGPNVLVDIGKTNAIMFPGEQVPGERYFIGQRLRVFVVRVEQTSRGPQIVVSRSHPGMVRRLFELEVPEVAAGTVEIRAISREAGARTKVAVFSDADGVDPVGSCVGQRGTRVQAVMADLGEEKIDIILFSDDPVQFISNALSPAKVISVKLNENEKRAVVEVPEDQLSLAIGRSGQNVRLAAKLTGWNIDIEGADSSGIEQVEQKARGRFDKEAAMLAAVEAAAPVAETGASEPDEFVTKIDETPAVQPEQATPEIGESVEGADIVSAEAADQPPEPAVSDDADTSAGTVASATSDEAAPEPGDTTPEEA
jgi:transcription termination/antitermination protein NusA